jgi:hypothetical protein
MSDFSFNEHIGDRITITPMKDGARNVTTKFGPKNAYVATVNVGDETHEGVLLFNAALVSRCRKAGGASFSGVAQYVTTKGDSTRSYLDLV